MINYEIAALILTFVLSVAPLYYKIGRLEHKICQIYKMINVKAEWKK